MKNKNEKLPAFNSSLEEAPPVFKSWWVFYALVLGNLLFWIALFTLFTWMFR